MKDDFREGECSTRNGRGRLAAAAGKDQLMGFAHQFSGSSGWTDHSDRAKNVTRNFTLYVSEDTNGEWTGYVRGDEGEFFAHGKTAWGVLTALTDWVDAKESIDLLGGIR